MATESKVIDLGKVRALKQKPKTRPRRFQIDIERLRAIYTPEVIKTLPADLASIVRKRIGETEPRRRQIDKKTLLDIYSMVQGMREKLVEAEKVLMATQQQGGPATRG